MRWLFLLLLAACSKRACLPEPCFTPAERYIVFLVEARGLDYSTNPHLLRTIAKHPSDGTKNSDVGHAWILLVNGDEIICGGHSGETGTLQMKYIEGVFTLAEKQDPNPIRYLFCIQKDGHFQKGSGGHKATFAAKADLTEAQVQEIKDILKSYPFENYAISGNSCCGLIEQIGFKLGLLMDSSVTIEIQPFYKGIQLWEDPCYSKITIQSPDRLQNSLISLCKEGCLENVTPYIVERVCFSCQMKKTGEDIKLLPKRTLRWLSTF